jgi:uncharacterized membrane protein YeaQ/YmgE (transglycosylase-associated protein family)
MGIITFIIFGAIVGWIASMISGDNARQGLIGNIVVGIIGSFIGSMIANFFGNSGVTGFNIRSFLIGLAGSVVLLFVLHLFRGRRTRNNV